MRWRPKPRNWRRYFGYRPPSLHRDPMSAAQLLDQASAYKTWLAENRGMTRAEAAAHIEIQRALAQSRPKVIGADDEQLALI